MKRSELDGRQGPLMLKLPAAEVPHIVIEPNYTCNSRCRTCYNQERNLVKPLDGVCREIDLALRKRRIETVSLLGGEPTLHPSIADIIRFVKSRRCLCQILTNGIAFLKPGGVRLLRQIVGAGIDRIVLHADCGQENHGLPLPEFIDRVFSLLEEAGVYFGLSMTLYEENRASLAALARQFSRYRYFDGILATIVQETSRTRGRENPRNPASLREENEAIRAGLGIPPTVYIPSSADDNDICWLMYFYYMNAATGQVAGISKTLNRWYRRLYRLATGRQPFAATTSQRWLRIVMAFTLLVEFMLRPRRAQELARLLRGSNGLRAVRFHYIVIQSGPVWDEEKGQIRICHHCPDATIRNGRLTPVCLADAISPIDPRVAPARPEWRDAVFAHLGEVP